LVCDVDIPVSALLCDLSVNFPNVLIARYSEISGFNECAVDVLTLNFSHFLFVGNSQELTDELRIYCDYLDYFVPKLEQLAAYLIKIVHELKGDLIRILKIDPLREGN
jgi:hypothetical protein